MQITTINNKIIGSAANTFSIAHIAEQQVNRVIPLQLFILFFVT